MARDMTDGEWRAFLLAGPRTATLGWVADDGRPMTAAVWIDLDDDDVVFQTGGRSAKARAMARDPRVVLLVANDAEPFAFVRIDGEASISDDLDEVRRWAARIGGRYMGAERADEFGSRNGVPGEIVVRVRPSRVVAQTEI